MKANAHATASRRSRVKISALGLFLCISIAGIVVAQAASTQDPLDSISIMALGALDGRAVVKTADNKMHVLKLGDTLPGTKAVITQILGDKLVVEDAVDADGVARQQTVWISKGTGADGKSVVQRLNSEADPRVMNDHPLTTLEAVDPKTGKPEKQNKKGGR